MASIENAIGFRSGVMSSVIIVSIAMLTMLFVIHMIHMPHAKTEKFGAWEGATIQPTCQQKVVPAILNPADVNFIQGSEVPLNDFSTQWENNRHVPTVDGSVGGPHSMAMMSFNKCSPDCCPSTYSCNGGCVCETKSQQDLMSSRGGNRTPRQ